MDTGSQKRRRSDKSGRIIIYYLSYKKVKGPRDSGFKKIKI